MRFTRTDAPPIERLAPDRPTVFVVDGDAAAREALDPLVLAAGWQLHSVACAEEFLALPRSMTPSCLLTELHLPTLCGLELQRLLLDRPELPIIFMCVHTDLPTAVRAMRAGALEILTKPLATDEAMMVMGHAIDQSRAAIERHARLQVLQSRHSSLSAREREVMGLLVAGRLNKQVGFDLGISEITVKKHRGSLMRKMRARSFAELMTMISCLHRWSSETTANMRYSLEPQWSWRPSYTRIPTRTADVLPHAKSLHQSHA